MDRAALIQEAIKKAYEEQEQYTIRTQHENYESITRFYKKDKAIWCYMKTGCIETRNMVYKANTDKPYIRENGFIFHLGEKEIAIVRKLLGQKPEAPASDIKRFEVGKTYYHRWIGDHDLISYWTVISRTDMTVTITDGNETKKCRIDKYILENQKEEAVAPFGKYSMSPTLRAGKEA